MDSFDLSIKSITVWPSYTNLLAGNTTNTTGFVYTNAGWSPYAPAYPDPAPPTPEEWLRRRVKEVCELATA